MFIGEIMAAGFGKVRCYLMEPNFLRFVVLITPVDTVDNLADRSIKAVKACG